MKRALRIVIVLTIFGLFLSFNLVAAYDEQPVEKKKIENRESPLGGEYLGGSLGIVLSLGMGYGIKRFYELNRG